MARMMNLAKFLGLVDGEEHYYEEASTPSMHVVPDYTYVSEPTPAETPALPLADGMRLQIVTPRSYSDICQIGDEFRTGVPVIVNLTEIDELMARRVLDFCVGMTYAVHGQTTKVTRGVFVLCPANVDAGAAARAQLREDPFFN